MTRTPFLAIGLRLSLGLLSWNELELELELELIQTHMAQKPMLRVEMGALGAHQVKNMRGRAG